MTGRINLGRLYTLLVVWLILLIAPGALELLGTFGHFDLNSAIVGPIIGVWIVGYLAQFAVFMWISRIVDPGFLAWFAASLLPWAIDWTTPVSPLFGLLWVAIAIAVALWIVAHARRDESLREHGIHAAGTVLQVYQPFMNVIINGAYIKRKLRLRIEGVTNVPAYEATYDGLFMFGDVPSVGDKLPLLVDPQDPQRFEYDDAAGTSGTASEDLVTSADDSGSTDDSSTSIADELGKLGKLHSQGVLSDDEFDAAKRKVLT
jgi:Short C-terminal domain